MRTIAKHGFNFMQYTLRFTSWQVDLIQDRDDHQVMLHGDIDIRQCLCLDSLCSIYNQHRSFAGGQGTRNLVGEVYMSGRIDEIQSVDFTIVSLVVQTDSLCLNSDTTFTFQVHTIQHLLTYLITPYSTGQFDQAVSKC